MRKTVRWGILSTANIAHKAVIPAMLKQPYCKHLEIVAIASRDLQKAQAMAGEFGIPHAYGSYRDLLADKAVDAVYIPVPNHLHVPLAIEALQAGKHVLCEKPIGLSAAEAESLVVASKSFPHLKVMEAFMYRHHPQWQWTRAAIADGTIGELRTIQTFFSYFKDDPTNVRNQAEWGGGGLMDIGSYPISLSRYLFGSEPQRVIGAIENDPDFGVDRLTSSIMEFDGGTATFTCSTQLNGYQRMIAFGTTGRIEIEIPFNAPVDRPCRVIQVIGDTSEVIEFDTCDQYGIQADLFSRAILNDTEVPTPIEDSVANMRVIEAIFRSGKSGGWEEIGGTCRRP